VKKTIEKASPKNIETEIDFRIWFRDEFGIDYLEAVKLIKERKSETERVWRQVLVEHGVIN
jgi:hypothetical protein